MKASDKTANKQNRSILLMGSLFAVAVSLNLYQYLNTAESVLHRSHEIEKEVVNEGIKWTEIRTKTKTHGEKGQYELWLTHLGSQPELVNTFALEGISDLDWQMNGKSGVNVSYWAGAPEIGMEETFVYSYTGDEQIKISQEHPNGREFTFKKPKGPSYTVSYITNGACVGNTYDNTDAPKVQLQGISITSGLSKITTQKFLLSEASTIECDIAFDGYYNPPLVITNVSDEKIDFELANGKVATISLAYKSGEKPTVIVQE